MKKNFQILSLVFAITFFALTFAFQSDASCNDSVVNCTFGVESTNTLCQHDTACTDCPSLPYTGCCEKKFGKCKISFANWETRLCKSNCSSSSGGGNGCGCDSGICAECPTNN